jgi:DNA-directed RNA polymerase subunit beta'
LDENIQPEQAFESLKKNTLEAIKSYFPDGKYAGRKQSIHLTNLRVEDNLKSDDVSSQTEVKDKDGTWGVPIKADMKLVDNTTGKVIDETKGSILARLPKLTNRYSYIVNGSEYQVDHLFRLKSGIYARVQDNGELESEFNLAKGGRPFSVHLDPVKRKLSMKYGNSHIPLYPIMKSLGVADDDIEKSWGKALFEANKPKTDEKFNGSLAKLVKLVSEEPVPADLSPDDLHKHVNSFFNQLSVRPDTTKLTLGEAHEAVTGKTLLQAAHKLLGVSRGTHQPDDRDSLAFKETASIEDFIPEKILRAGARTIRPRLRQTIDQKQSVRDIVASNLFGRPVGEFFTKGGSVAERSEQTNPIQMLSAHRKTTLMSRDFGGIKSENSLTEGMQTINQSHFGFLDPMHTPEGEKIGITLHLASHVRKNGKDLEIPVFDTHTGKSTWVNAVDFHGADAVLPDQVTWVDGKPKPISATVRTKTSGGDIVNKPFKDSRYVMPSTKGMWNYASNLVPFLSADNGNRIMMADKQMEQAIGLKHREVPLVQSKTDHGDPEHTFEKLLGHFIASRAPAAGKVSSIKGDVVHIAGDDGKKHEVHLYNNFPLNDAKGMLHSDLTVKVGDKVRKGQVVADNNFTKDGSLAIGTNLRVGYIPYKGYNFEDGIVISESAAKKLTSEHLHKKIVEIDPDNDHIGKAKYQAWAISESQAMPKAYLDALEDNGVVKVGTKVKPGQVLVAAIGKNDTKKASLMSAYGNKRAFKPVKNKSMVWDEDHEGTVTKVVHDPQGRGVRVYVRTDEPVVIGDKLTGRHGNKGIVSLILPDHEMPFTKNAKGERESLHVLLNPSGIPSRINPGQMLETAAGKIAEKTGKPYIVDNFGDAHSDHRTKLEKELKAHGITDEETVYDPSDTRRALGSVLVGPQYVLKLKHQVEKKVSARGGGTDVNGRKLAVDTDQQPVKGGEHGGQGFGALEMYSLLGHNARHNIREMSTYKSDNQDMLFWNMIQNGHEPPPPTVPFSYRKFEGLLRGLGVNVTKDGTSVRIHPITNKEVLRLTGNRELKDAAKTLRSKDLKPVPGGLFDEQLTGGLDGDKWSHIKLDEPVPNPIFCGGGNQPGPVPVLLGLKMKEFEDVMAGKHSIGGLTGGAAVEAALKKVDVHKEVDALKRALPGLRADELDRANKKLKYLLALKDLDLKPHDAYMMHYVPVVPPKFRPASATPSGDVNYSPLNGHYKNISLINEHLRNFDSAHFDDKHKQPLRTQLWDAMKALQAVGTHREVYDTDQSGDRALKGILDIIGGKPGVEQPKEGYFQSKLVKRRQNLSVRSTIVPEPKLGIDEVGLPKGAAMEMYKPYVVAQLQKWNFHPLAAQDEIKKMTPIAFRALEKVVVDRPLLLKRDPVLHKFGVMAFKPKLVEGKAIQIHPLVCGGFNADFDGDTMAGTIPMSREAVEEAKKLFPSNNLFSPTNYGAMYLPANEALLGLHLLSKWGKKTGKTFANTTELNKAVDEGHADVTDVVHLKGMKEPTTLGRLLLESRLPRGYSQNSKVLHNSEFEFSKRELKKMAPEIANKHRDHYANTVDSLKNLGNEWSYKLGFSIGLKDLKTIPQRDAIIGRAEKKVHELSSKGEAHDADVIRIYQGATGEIEEAQKLLHGGPTQGDHRLAQMVFSGARGDASQLRQMIAAPMLVESSSGKVVPYPLKRSFAEGLDIGDFWMYQHGARKGMIQKGRGTADPGAITKDIINASMSTLIVSPDCGTKEGVHMKVNDEDIHDRYLAAPYKLKDGTHIKAGELLTPAVLSRLKNSKIETVSVRSALKCAHGDGMCAKCFGLNESGVLHSNGTNIGILASQAMGEPSTQLSMRAFHTGGVAGSAAGKSMDAITRLRNLLEMPKRIRDEATVSMATGKVSAVRKDPAGGADIIVTSYHNDQPVETKHYIPRHLINEDIKVGSQVKRGDKLSGGFVNPHRLLESTKSIHAVQNYLTDELHDGLFKGLGVRRRNIEVAVRNITNLTKVKDPGHSEWLPGDILPRSVVEEHNRTKGEKEAPVIHEPVLKGVGEIPRNITTDWMARLNYQNLHSTVRGAAAMAQKSNIHGSHPIPGLAYGAEFGRPPADLKSKKPHVY